MSEEKKDNKLEEKELKADVATDEGALADDFSVGD